MSDEQTVRDREDGAHRQAQQGHRAAPQPPRAGRGRTLRGRRGACSRWPSAVCRKHAAGEELDLGFVGSDQTRRCRRPEPHRGGLRTRGGGVRRQATGTVYNVNADEAAGAVAGALTPRQGDLPDRRRRMAGRPQGPPRRSSRRPTSREMRRAASRPGDVAGGVCRSCRPASAAVERGGRLGAHGGRGASRIRFCWSCWGTLGIGTEVRGRRRRRVELRQSGGWSSRPRT